MTRYYFEDEVFQEEPRELLEEEEEQLYENNTFYETDDISPDANDDTYTYTHTPPKQFASLIPKIYRGGQGGRRGSRNGNRSHLFTDPEETKATDPIRWAKLKLGKTVINVCSEGGLLRREGDPFWKVATGVPLTGTPYTYVMIETETAHFERFFVHQLVWEAFHGPPHSSWEVRHKPYIPLNYSTEYPNDLYHLDIYPKTCDDIEIFTGCS